MMHNYYEIMTADEYDDTCIQESDELREARDLSDNNFEEEDNDN